MTKTAYKELNSGLAWLTKTWL